MRIIASIKSPSGLLLIAVVLGLAAANSPIHSFVMALINTAPSTCLGSACFALTFQSGVEIFGVSAFFYLVGLELKRELTGGALTPLRNAISPLFAAILGVLMPALWYLAFNFGQSTQDGWPIPTATDVTFALAVFVAFGSALPQAARTFLLAFAVIDDVIAVIIVGVMFTGSHLGFPFGFWPILIPFAAFLVLQRTGVPGTLGKFVALLAVIFLGIALLFTSLAGIEPALLAVVAALFTPKSQIAEVESRLGPQVTYWILPLFAFIAAFVKIPATGSIVWPVLIGITARPIWKFVGVFLGGWIGGRFATGSMRLTKHALWRVAALGGIGFTVSLLVAKLAFAAAGPNGGNPAAQGTAVLATLLASIISVVLGAIALARGHRTQSTDRA